MGTGYTRNDTANNIADGNVINASDLDGEFDAVQAAFNGTTGHSHDGTSGEGPQIGTAGIANDAVTGDKLANNIQIAGTLGVTGETTLTTHLNMGDSDVIKLGDGADLLIYHDGSNNFIAGNSGGNNTMVIKPGGTGAVLITNSAGDNIISQQGDVAHLHHNGFTKLVTSSTGVTVTGNVVVSGTVDGRDVATDGTKLDGIESGATADQSASEILTLIKTVDGAGSGLDADTLDGISSASFLRSDAADIKTSGNLIFNDGIKAEFGTSSDLQIYHDGSNSIIKDTGTGNLYIDGSGTINFRSGDGGEYYAVFNDNGKVSLRYDNVEKLFTKADGVDITGELQCDSLDVDGTSNFANDITLVGASIAVPDNEAVRFGAGQDLQLYHDASSGNSFVLEQGTGSLILQGTNIQLKATDSTSLAEFNDAGAVNLRYSGDLKLNTTSTGINVNGDINAVDNVYVANAIYHEGDTDTYMQFHAANAWRVVTGNTQMLEVNDNYIQLSANSKASVQTTNVASSISPNMYLFNSFVLTLTGNISLTNPTTEVVGMSGVFVFIHSGAGRTVSLGTQYRTVGGAGLTLSGTAGAVDVVPYFVRATGIVNLGTPQLGFA